ncbi:VIT1/CCC1 transporter family protein [uncultured Roseovarius sp.]|uniref:VIT1/CCC1 transporter family protein n=1 Tax=uncultured Roseovarius sp. TaxID=293344 RepID=UPI00263696AA|nr:VIT1/CCC1 transporter family protein [uncultured Roseovarius sp.]
MDRQAQGLTQSRLGHKQEFLKQIVFGGTDGIVTTFAIVAGFAGAQAEGVAQVGGLAVLLFGLANLLADAVSMGLGEFLSLRAQHDLYRARKAHELRAIHETPDIQATHLANLLQARGLGAKEARTTATTFLRHPDLMSETILSHATGLTAPETESPLRNGLFTFGAFVCFGVVPLIPYMLFDATEETTRMSIVATLLALILLGLLRWSATGHQLWRSLGETVLVGTVCAVVAFTVGVVVGA